MAPKRKAPGGVAAGSPAAKEPQVFSGCRLVFWAHRHMAVTQQRAKQLGGVQQPAVAADTTHVICPPNLTAQQAADKLRGWSGPTREVAVGQGASVRLPEGVAFVTPDWVSRSIPKHHLLPEEQFLPPGLAPAPASPAAATQAAAGHDGAGTGGQQQQEQQEQQQPQQREHPTGADAEQHRDAAPAGPEPTSSTATVPFSSQQMWAAGQDAQQQDVLQGPAFCRVERRGSEFVAVQGAKPLYTGGDTGIAWGSYGVWQEPYDEAAARQTVDKLRAYWFHTHTAGQEAPPTSPQPPKTSQLNGVCSHVCCSRRPFCVVQGLSDFKTSVYFEGRDQFQMKAIDKAVQGLIMWNEALESEEDVDKVPGLGPKSKVKVKEILAKGTSSRIAAAAADEQRKVLTTLLEVWGTGTASASRWYSLGVRTLDNLRSRTDLNLTEQQRVGLKYYDDLKQKIPRAEVAQTEKIVRETCFELIERWGGTADVERTYCSATGSYLRGKPQSSDVDILICLPPSLSHADCHDFLTELLAALLHRGLLLDEMNTRHAQRSSSGNIASWMGLAKPPGAPHIRRIDIKVYASSTTPFALNYFGNSQSFCRATRYWANTGVAEAARKYNAAANGFKISDRDMVPIYRPPAQRHHRRSRGGGGGSDSEGDAGAADGGTTVLEPAVACPDETTIFRELGLAYVPPHMRYFHDFF